MKTLDKNHSSPQCQNQDQLRLVKEFKAFTLGTTETGGLFQKATSSPGKSLDQCAKMFNNI